MYDCRKPLALEGLAPISKGNLRLVYEHPDDRSLLVKVMRPDAVESRYRSSVRKRRFGEYVLFVREIHEYLAAHAAAGVDVPFAQVITGTVETDLGLGLVTVAVRGPDGRLAPTLADLIDHGNYTPEAQAAFEEFIRGMLACDMVLSDLHERNLVYAHEEGKPRRFVMIDGIGDSNFLPVKTWFPSINRRSKISRVARLRKRMALRETRRAAANPGYRPPDLG